MVGVEMIVAILFGVIGYGVLKILPKNVATIVGFLATTLVMGLLLASLGYGQLVDFMTGIIGGIITAGLAGFAVGANLRNIF